MSYRLDVYGERVKAQVDQCRDILHQIMGEIDGHFVEYLMLTKDRDHFEASAYMLGLDLDVLDSIVKPSKIVTDSISEKEDAKHKYEKQEIPILKKKISEFTAKFALYFHAVQQLRGTLRERP